MPINEMGIPQRAARKRVLVGQHKYFDKYFDISLKTHLVTSIICCSSYVSAQRNRRFLKLKRKVTRVFKV